MPDSTSELPRQPPPAKPLLVSASRRPVHVQHPVVTKMPILPATSEAPPLEFEASPSAADLLSQLSNRMGVDTPEVISWALAILVRAVNAEDKGQSLALVDPEGHLVAKLPTSPPTPSSR